MKWLIAYDVADSCRLQRVFKMLRRYALPLQESVFVFSGRREDLCVCLESVAAGILDREDDVRVYRLPNRGFFRYLGEPPLPIGIFLPDVAPLGGLETGERQDE